MIDNDVLSIIIQAKKDISNIRQRFKESINDKQLLDEITCLLARGKENDKVSQWSPIITLVCIQWNLAIPSL